MTEKRRIGLWLFCVAVIVSMIAAFPASIRAEDDETATYEPQTNDIPGWPQKDPIYGESCVLMDNDSNAILCSLNRDTKRYPASTTKVMTCLLTLENLPLDATVTMTAEGTAGVADDSSNAGTVIGEEFTVEQCLYMLMLKSANDIANQLAVEVSGSIETFAEKMTARAVEIGCTGTHFHNASGMPDDEHYTTAMDLALIFQEALKNDKFREIISTVTYTVPPTNKYDEPRVYTNHNSLINPDTEYYYEYCIGGKTGFTNAAQRTLVTASVKEGRTLICVTMRTPDKSDYYDQRNLYNYGFDNFTTTRVGSGSVVLPTTIDSAPLLALFAAHSSGNGTPTDASQTSGTDGTDLAEQGAAASSSAAVASNAASAADPSAAVESSSAAQENSLYTASYDDLGSGLEKVTYYYSSLPVGSAVEEIPQTAVVSEAESVAETPTPAVSAAAGSGGGSLLMPILIAVAVIALAAAGVWYKRQLDRQREKLRRRQQARRAEERKAKNADTRQQGSGEARQRKNAERGKRELPKNRR